MAWDLKIFHHKIILVASHFGNCKDEPLETYLKFLDKGSHALSDPHDYHQPKRLVNSLPFDEVWTKIFTKIISTSPHLYFVDLS